MSCVKCFDKYMDGFNDLLQIVQSLETVYVRMSQVTNIESLKEIYNDDCHSLFEDAGYAIDKVRKNDITQCRRRYSCYSNDKTKQFKKTCREYNREFRKIKRKYKEYEKLCAKIYADGLIKFSRGNELQDVIVNDKRLKLIVEKLKAEAKIKEADAVIAAAEKAKADLAIEEHKTEQLRLQAEERKAREEEAILSVEERCKIMYNEFLNTLQDSIVNPTR